MFLTIENGFADRPMEVDPLIIRRIIRAYKLSKEAQKDAGEEYQVGYMWLPIYEGFMNEIMTALSSEDEAAVGGHSPEPGMDGLGGVLAFTTLKTMAIRQI